MSYVSYIREMPELPDGTYGPQTVVVVDENVIPILAGAEVVCRYASMDKFVNDFFVLNKAAYVPAWKWLRTIYEQQVGRTDAALLVYFNEAAETGLPVINIVSATDMVYTYWKMPEYRETMDPKLLQNIEHYDPKRFYIPILNDIIRVFGAYYMPENSRNLSVQELLDFYPRQARYICTN